MHQDGQCSLCGLNSLNSMVEYGKNPVSNRFSKSKEGAMDVDSIYDISLGYCAECNHIQLTNKIPINAIRPRYSWITYSEPEDHLDNVTTKLFKSKFITEKSKILGSTYKDNSLLERFSSLNANNTKEINDQDLSIFNLPTYGIETIVEQLSKRDIVNNIKNKYGLFDLIVTRHTVEHAIDARKFLLNLSQLLNDNGRMLIEIPDNKYLFESGNHAFVWEEHISYFTEDSMRTLCKIIGAKVILFSRYKYLYEDSLVVLIEFDKSIGPLTFNNFELTSDKILSRFSESLQSEKIKWHSRIDRYKRNNLTVAVFGANHLAVRFINYFKLADVIDYVIDDNHNKSGCFMPGSNIPIISSIDMFQKDINICISTLSPDSEKIVLKKMKIFIDNGGRFIKAFKPKVISQ
jgi:hypothetical protein